MPKNEKTALYEGPDAHNQCFDIPEGEVDVFNVVVGRRKLQAETNIGNDDRTKTTQTIEKPSTTSVHRELGDAIVPGKGWEVWGEPQGYCDGTYNAVCDRSGDVECVLLGHHDAYVLHGVAGYHIYPNCDAYIGFSLLISQTWSHSGK